MPTIDLAENWLVSLTVESLELPASAEQPFSSYISGNLSIYCFAVLSHVPLSFSLLYITQNTSFTPQKFSHICFLSYCLHLSCEWICKSHCYCLMAPDMWAIVSHLLFGLVWLCSVSPSTSPVPNRCNSNTFSEFLCNYSLTLSVDLLTENIRILVKQEKQERSKFKTYHPASK